jgi:hypothetical protein
MSLSRPIVARKDTKADEASQRRACIARDGNVCQFEREYIGPLHRSYWHPCGKKSATDTAHVYRRRECAKAAFHVDVVIRACRDCHDAYDQAKGGVRVPAYVEERAWRAIVANSKVLPPRQDLEGFRL